MSDAERSLWLRLYRSENVGPIAFRQLLQRYGTAQEALDALPDLAKRGGKRGFKAFSAPDAAREIDTLGKLGAKLIAACEPDYPELLREAEDAPPVIAVIGHPHIWEKPCVAIVGARNASFNGLRFAEDLARPGVVRIVERWRDWASLEAHGKAPHMAPWAAVAGKAGITSREVIAHAAGEEKIL
ncbi:MAG: DNA-processing protein DprA [Proteobacteria bacterium]|nr:DNA-processing protein DprA [Pseudomonadota bacterium]